MNNRNKKVEEVLQKLFHGAKKDKARAQKIINLLGEEASVKANIVLLEKLVGELLLDLEDITSMINEATTGNFLEIDEEIKEDNIAKVTNPNDESDSE